MLISFGPFTFDARNGLLSNAGTEIPLPPRVIGVLGLLLARPAEVVSRQELLEQVWKDAYVTDTSLAEAVSFLRQALGDDPQNPQYIQTVHRRGYRFVAPLTMASTNGVAAQAIAVAPVPPSGVVEPLRPSIARDLAPWSIALISAAMVIASLWYVARQPVPGALPVARFEFRPVAGSWFDTRAPAVAVSRDGTVLAWSACDGRSRVCGLYVRRLDRLEPVRLGGTDGAQAPFFSPDGRWIGFFADGKLKKVALSGGAPIALADAPVPGGGSWNDDGRIVFAAAPAGGLWIASDQGGEVTRLTTPQFARGEVRHVWPAWLPGYSALVFTIATSPVPGAPGELAVLPWPPSGLPAPSSWRVLRGGVTRAMPGGHGYLLVSTGNDLQALTFDERTLTLTGNADAVMENLATARGIAQFMVSDAGTLLALRASAVERTFGWSDAPGRTLPALGRLRDIVVAPNGRMAAGVSIDAAGSDIWTVNLDSGAASRVTFGGTNVSPAWAEDSVHLFYAARRKDGPFMLASVGFDTGRQPMEATHVFPASVAPDGRIAVQRALDDGRYAVFIVGRAPAPVLLDEGPLDDMNPVFSPDGRWLAYESDASGRSEIVVRGPSGQRVVVTSTGGERPAWSADGRSLYYFAGERLMRVPFAASAAGAAETVFDRLDARVLAVTPSGRVLIEQQPLMLDSAVVVLQWLREVRQKLPAPISAPR